MKSVFKSLLLSVSFSLLILVASAQNEILYQVRFPNIVHHEAEISMTVPAPAGPLKVRMARSSPGRYATHEFGKNVYNVKATDAAGKLLPLKRISGDEYQVTVSGKSATISYTLYGNWMDGTYAGFDRDHAHMNIPATFMFPVGMDSRARVVEFFFPENPQWKVATQLKHMGGNKYFAKDFQYFMDSPVEIAALKTVSWEVAAPGGKKQRIHYVSNTPDEMPVLENFAGMLKKMTDEHAAVWGEYPVFDYGDYYFLQSVHPENAGDGMEHRNSTVIVERDPSVAGNESDQLSTFSHEFFHTWNVERLRPKSLEPFNFNHSNMTEALWLAEGFTQYYGQLLLKRAGFRTLDQISATMNGIVNTVLNTPGARDYSPVQASNYAVFADAGVAVDQTNKANIFTSYYTYGAGVALALDLRLRASYKLTLDDYMRALWKAHGKPEIPYTLSDLQNVLAQLTRDPKFAAQFFANFVNGTAKEDYAGLLKNAGFILQPANPDRAYSGIGRVTFSNGKAVMSSTMKGSPAYIAGLDVGDVLLEIDGKQIKEAADVGRLSAARKPGEKMTVKYSHRGKVYETTLSLTKDPALQIVPIEKTGQLSPEAAAFRDSWLNTQVKN